jgi:hypothetical protein
MGVRLPPPLRVHGAAHTLLGPSQEISDSGNPGQRELHDMAQAVVEPVERGSRIECLPAAPINVVVATFYGVLGARAPYATASGVEAFVGCHALNCYR